jgi:uncharacterized protein YndB with AHSA1/START domain
MGIASKTPTNPSGTDRIEKTIVLNAPRSKVWRALTDSAQFGKWFGVKLQEPFVSGRTISGPILIPGYEHLRFEVAVERMEPEQFFSWRWQPGGDPDKDPAEPTTLVAFQLEEVPQGTRLTVAETGFDRIPLSRRDKAYRENEKGWTGQMEAIRRYLASTM